MRKIQGVSGAVKGIAKGGRRFSCGKQTAKHEKKKNSRNIIKHRNLRQTPDPPSQHEKGINGVKIQHSGKQENTGQKRTVPIKQRAKAVILLAGTASGRPEEQEGSENAIRIRKLGQ